MSLPIVFIFLLFLFSLVSRRLERTGLTAPIFFTSGGLLVSLLSGTATEGRGDQELFLTVAEIGLVLLLFTDASGTSLEKLRRSSGLPVRLLSIGMLLAIALGTLLARWVFPGLSLWEAGILAAILAPTDAGLGQVIVNSPRVPEKVRRALNVEAGLNDGLSVPFLLFFIVMAGSGSDDTSAKLWPFIIEQLGYGTLVGIGIGVGGGWLLGRAHHRGWIAPSWLQLGVVTLPILCLLASDLVGASMFIAAFVAGLAVQVGFKDASKHSVEFTEEWGKILNLSVFFLFGLFVGGAWDEIGWRHVVYALLSLTVIRMLPVALSLIGTRLSKATVLFIGWFGPRGLASIVLVLVYLEHSAGHPMSSAIHLTVTATVFISVYAHGLSALPGIAAYGRKIESLPPDSPEREAVPPAPNRPLS